MRARALPVLGIAVVLAAPLAFRDEVGAAALTRVVAYAIAATGVSLVSGVAGQISLGHGALMGAGALTAAGLAVHAGLAVPVAWVAGVALAAALGLALGAPSLRVRGPSLALATLGGGVIVFQVARQASSLTGGELGLPGVPAAAAPLATAFLGCALLAAALLVTARAAAAVPGLRMRAVRDSEPGAEASGVNLTRTKLGAFVASAVMAGCAGALYAHAEGFVAVGAFDPSSSFTLVLAAVIGGLRSPLGGAIGALVIFGPSELAPGAFDWLAEYQLIAWGPVGLLIVFRFPEGIAGAIAAAARRRVPSEPPGRETREPVLEHGTRPALDPAVAPVLEARDVTVRFGGVVALAGVSLAVRPATIHALIGPNGSGKTTLVDCLTGFRRPASGSVWFDGRDVTGLTPDAIARSVNEFRAAREIHSPIDGLPGGLGRTFQTVALFGSMTCQENLAVAQASRGGIDETAAREVLALVGLAGFEATPAAALSYGQRKRLELARALALQPGVLVLDEPAAGRNEPEILALGRLLMHLRAEGRTILVVEHHMNFVLAFADVVTALDEGRVVAEGPPAVVRNDERVIEAYLGAPA